MPAQVLRIVAANLLSLPARWGPSLVVVISMAGVVGVTLSILAMGSGFRETLGKAARADRVIVLRAGEDNGMGSAITREQVPVIFDAPGIARDTDGKALASAQKFMISGLSERSTGKPTNVIVRGVGEQAFKIWPEVRIIEGRSFEFGKRELIAGRGALWNFPEVRLGQEVELVNGAWTVVGIFEADGSNYESELWGDAEQVMAGYSLTGQFASITAVLESVEHFGALADFIGTNPQLNHAVKREHEYYVGQTGGLVDLVQTLGYSIAAIMSLGVVFAAINTMYAAVRARSLEIATLRALGFGAAPVVLSVLVEALALCVAGALLGAGLAWLMFNGYAASTVNWQTGGQVAFALRVSGELFLQAAAAACVVALLGGLLPAIRAARLPVAEALRTS